MDVLARFEIYIPKEAEVKTIPLWSLPNSTLRGIGLARPGGKGSKNLLDSPKATWISPAVIRERGGPIINHAGDVARASMTSLVKKELQMVQGPFHMSFISSNCAAYTVLREFLPTRRISRQPTQASPLPHGSPPRTLQDAVIIYSGHIYLSIRKPKIVRGPGETPKSKPNEPAPAARSLQVPQRTLSTPASSPSASKGQKMSQPASPESEDSELVTRERSLMRPCLTVSHQAQVMLPKMTLDDLKNLAAKTRVHSTREPRDPKPVTSEPSQPASPESEDSELVRRERSLMRPCLTVSHQAQVMLPKMSSENLKSLAAKTLVHSTREPRDPKPVTSEPESSHDTGSKRKRDRVKDDTEDTESPDEDRSSDREADAAPSSSSSSLVGVPGGEDPGEEEVTDDWSHDEGMLVDSDELEAEFGVKEDLVELPLVPAFTSNPVQLQDFDFDQLAQEEMIARIKAKLREREDALDNLRPST